MRSVVVVLSLLIVLPSGAAGAPRADSAQAPAHDPRDCTCRAQGRNFGLGERVCLRTADGPRLAECQMALNLTSWAVTETPCVDS